MPIWHLDCVQHGRLTCLSAAVLKSSKLHLRCRLCQVPVWDSREFHKLYVNAGSMPSWASGLSTERSPSMPQRWAPQQQRAEPQMQSQRELDFAEPSLGTFEFSQTQSAQDAERARHAVLPPLQSVLELTDAVRPPQRGEEPQLASSSAAGKL